MFFTRQERMAHKIRETPVVSTTMEMALSPPVKPSPLRVTFTFQSQTPQSHVHMIPQF